MPIRNVHLLVFVAGSIGGVLLGTLPRWPSAAEQSPLPSQPLVERTHAAPPEKATAPQEVSENPWRLFQRPGDIFRAWDQYLNWLETQPAESLGVSLNALEESFRILDEEAPTAEMGAWLNFLHLAHWADVMPEAAFDHVGQLEEERSLVSLVMLYAAWARRDLQGALAPAGRGETGRRMTMTCLNVENFYHPRFDLGWAKRSGIDFHEHVRLWMGRGESPESLLQSALAESGLSAEERRLAVAQVFQETATLPGMTLTDSLRLLERLPDDANDLHQAARDALLESWAAHDNPLTALKAVYALTGDVDNFDSSSSAAPRLPRDRDRFSAIGKFHEAMSAYPEATIRWVMEDLDQETRGTLLEKMYSGSGSGSGDLEVSGWFELYLSLPPGERPSVRGLTAHAHKLSRDRPRQTLAWLEQLPLEDITDMIDKVRLEGWARSVAATLTQQDHEDALRRVEALEEGPIRQAAIRGLIEELAWTHPEEARNQLDQLPEEDRRKAEAQVIRAYVSGVGFEAGKDYLDTLDDTDLRSDAVKQLIEMGPLRPEERRQLVDLYLKDEEDPLSSTRRFIGIWARSDPQAAGNWLKNYEGSASYPYTIDGVIEPWRFQDFEAATAFAQTLPPGPALDYAIRYLTELAQDVDPQAALAWQTRISEDESRLNSLEKGLIRIDESADHPEAVWEALDGLEISEAERTALQERLGF